MCPAIKESHLTMTSSNLILSNISIYPHLTLGLICILLFSLFSCEKTEVNPVVNAIDIDLVVLDEEMQEGKVFKQGENFMLMLKATNNSDQELKLDDFRGCAVFNDPDFSKIHIELNNQLYLIGRCLEDLDYICLALYLPRKMSPNESINLVGARWLNNPENANLLPGNYVSKYTLEYNGREFHTYAEFSIE